MLYELLFQTREEQNTYIEQIKRYVLDHLAEELPVRQSASEIGLSRVYCGALLKKRRRIHPFLYQLHVI